MTSSDAVDEVKDKTDESQEETFERVIINADDFIIKNAPPTIRYIPNFIDEEMEDYLLWQVENAPKPKWEFLKNRRLQNWGGIVGKKALISDNNMPEWLNLLIDKIMEVENAFPESNRPNHVLVNEYLPGQGIMPHTDGPAFFPMVSTVSLGSHTLLDLYEPIDEQNVKPQAERYLGSMLLQPRSLILIKDDAYTKKLHGIEERKSDVIDDKVFNKPPAIQSGMELERGTRISLTIRNVPKTCTDYADNCSGVSSLCTDAIYYDIMTTNCASTCGRCTSATTSSGTCTDKASNCANYFSKCQDSKYTSTLSENCAQTCGVCSGDGSCRDVSSACSSWKNNGFCNSTFYTAEYKKTTCGVTCGLC